VLAVVYRCELVATLQFRQLFRASIRSLLLPSFNRAFSRGSHTTRWVT
jgi:hypothetical protein